MSMIDLSVFGARGSGERENGRTGERDFEFMSALDTITQAFGQEVNLYTDVLGIDVEGDTTAVTLSQLRKAYYRRALKVRSVLLIDETILFDNTLIHNPVSPR